MPPLPKDWRLEKTPHKALQAALVPTVSAQCRHMSQGAFTHDQEARLLVVVPKSWEKAFLETAHASRHQGIDRTLARLSEVTYWVGQGRDVISHWWYCTRCQLTKSSEQARTPAPVIAREPWEMVVVDILKFLHLVKEMNTSWWRRITLQSGHLLAHCQTRPVLRDDVFPLFEVTDQGWYFQSRILGDLCAAFRVKKSLTTPFLPMGVELV